MPRLIIGNHQQLEGVYFTVSPLGDITAVQSVSDGGGASGTIYDADIIGALDSICYTGNALLYADSSALGGAIYFSDTGDGFELAQTLHSSENTSFPARQRWLASDLSSRSVVWLNETTYNDPLFTSRQFAWYTTDGYNWDSVALLDLFNEVAEYVVAAPLHDGSQCYMVSHMAAPTNLTFGVHLVDTSGNLSSQTITGWDGDGFQFATVSNLNSDILLLLDENNELWQYSWSANTMTSVNTFTPGSGGRFTDMTTTMNGVVLLVESNYDSDFTEYLYIQISSDVGVTWDTPSDLSSMKPAGSPGEQNNSDRISVTPDNLLLMAFNDGTIAFSSDDALNWAQTSVLVTANVDSTA